MCIAALLQGERISQLHITAHVDASFKERSPLASDDSLTLGSTSQLQNTTDAALAGLRKFRDCEIE